MRIQTVRDQANGSFAPVEHAEDYEVISQHPLPIRFHGVYRTNGKYALIPAGIGLVIAVLIYMAGLNYKLDPLASVALGAVFVFGGFSLGNVRVRNLTESFRSHASVVAVAEESGLSAKEIADMLTRFALRLENETTASINSETKMFVNLTESSSVDDSPALAQEAQSFGLLRRTPSVPAE
jgi:hypothetical protein